ncbi:hypothetical protein PEC302110_00160 [Pectobacterium araliae]|uniref:PTS EIIB type-3 domain-containing protein n=1 Tax=Pectobacterium araliae TaxID=3073862 RepID=A0AAN0K874_9GAMM|nr:hypothetical protein PEC302110_00160 [Pectobacterium sp. MAFF 302110]
MLVQRMEKVAEKKAIAVEIKAVVFEVVNGLTDEYDCCLLGPQIKYKLPEFKAIADEKKANCGH